MHQKRPEEKQAGLKVSFLKKKRIDMILAEINGEIAIPDFPINQRADRKGHETEERFFLAWSYKGNYPPWLREVLRATMPENLYSATDAIFCRYDGKRIKVQIKSSTFYAEEHKRKHPDIPVVVIYQTDNDKTIRRKTLEAIAEIYKI